MTSDKVSDTPRTDRVARGRTEIASPTVVDVEFARTLERELAALRAAQQPKLFEGARMGVQLTASAARIKELEDALRGLDPYLDQLICYASTPDEYEPNRAVAIARRALATNSRVEGEDR